MYTCVCVCVWVCTCVGMHSKVCTFESHPHLIHSTQLMVKRNQALMNQLAEKRRLEQAMALEEVKYGAESRSTAATAAQESKNIAQQWMRNPPEFIQSDVIPLSLSKAIVPASFPVCVGGHCSVFSCSRGSQVLFLRSPASPPLLYAAVVPCEAHSGLSMFVCSCLVSTCVHLSLSLPHTLCVRACVCVRVCMCTDE